MYVITASFIHNYFAVFIIYVSTGSSSINTVTVWPRSPAGVNPTMLFVHAICARHLRGARIFFSKPLPIGLEMGWDPRIFGLPQIGAEMGRKCRILHRNKKYKKDIKIQLVSQWVCSMSFKITKVKLLFLGGFSVLFVHLLRKWRIPNFPRSSGGKHDKNDKKKSHFPFTLLLAFLGGYGVWGEQNGVVAIALWH